MEEINVIKEQVYELKQYAEVMLQDLEEKVRLEYESYKNRISGLESSSGQKECELTNELMQMNSKIKEMEGQIKEKDKQIEEENKKIGKLEEKITTMKKILDT